MLYLSENPFPLFILLAAGVVVSLLTGTAKGRGVAGLCVLLGVGLFFLERWLISPGEHLEAEVQTMLQHFKDRDLDAITAQISTTSPELTAVATQGLDLVDIHDSFHIKNVEVTFDEADTSATVLLRANGDISLRKQGGGQRYVPTFWRTTWIREDDGWKLSKVMRLNPANGQEMGYFAGR